MNDNLVKILALLVGLIFLFMVVLIIALFIINVKEKKEAERKNNKNQEGKQVKKSSIIYTPESIIDFMDFEKVENNMIIQKNGKYLMVVECQGINYDLMSEMEKVAVEQGSAGDSSIEGLSNKINRVNSQLDALNEVLAGTSDCAVIDYTMAYSLVGKGNYANLSIIDASKISFEKEVFAVGLRKGSDLKAKLDEFLRVNFKNNKLDLLAEKYGVAINKDAFID